MTDFTRLNPAADEKDVASSRPICFRGPDSCPVTVRVRDEQAVIADVAQTGWSVISKVVGSERDYCVFPTDLTKRWADGEVIKVKVTCTTPAVETSWIFTARVVAEQPFSIYRMIMRSIRQHDERSPGILQRLIEGGGGINDIWKEDIFDPATALPTLFEPANVDDKWIPWLLAIVGFTRDLNFDATEDELRQIIGDAVLYWNTKPSEDVINKAIRLVSGNRFRIRNFFDLVFKTDETRVTENLGGLDPNTLVTEIVDVSGTKLTTQGVPSQEFTIADVALPDFKATDEYHTLIVEGHPALDDGIFAIDKLTIGTKKGKIKNQFFSAATAVEGPWKLLGVHSDFTIEVRLVDQGTGTVGYDNGTAAFTVGATILGATSKATAIIIAITGTTEEGTLTVRKIRGRFQPFEVLTDSTTGVAKTTEVLVVSINRQLIEFLMNLPRVSSERIDVAYITFLDQFLTPLDLDQWTITGAGSITVPTPGGEAIITGVVDMVTSEPDSPSWDDVDIAWKLQGKGPGLTRLVFGRTDASNYYFIEVDYGTSIILPGSVRLFKFVAGVPTALVAAVTVTAIVPDIDFLVRVDMIKVSSDTSIRVRVDGDEQIDVLDSPGAFQKGSVGMVQTGSPNPAVKVKLIEVMNLPIEVNRVGRNP